jgi:microcystin degradation protein MlrC
MSKKFIVLKEGLNPFIEYRDVAKEIIVVDSPGFNPQRLKRTDYTRIEGPMYPFDEDLQWEA